MTKKILIVRSSSLGDIVHLLPAISDIQKHVKDFTMDWVVEEAFSEIPLWHPAVNDIIEIAHRRWRKDWFGSRSRSERKKFINKLQSTKYDYILDMQSLLKSAWVVWLAKGTKHGLNWKSAKESPASLFYNIKHNVEYWQTAVTRQRILASKVFGYEFEGEPDFGLQAFTNDVQVQNFAAIMPSASTDEKLWDESAWHAVFSRLREYGIPIRVFSGSVRETERARELVKDLPDAEVLPRMNLTEVANTLASCKVMVGLDSGLTHLSAALGRPTIGIYTCTSPIRTPVVGSGYTASLGDVGVPPSQAMVLSKLDEALGK